MLFGQDEAEQVPLMNGVGLRSKWCRLLTWAVLVPYGTGAGLKIVPEPATQIGLLCILAA